ncbi:MAG: hypothetical protein ACLTDA_08935 [[Eubacterium] siraeum]
MSDESRKAALETMDAYIEAIKSKQAEAVSASCCCLCYGKCP